MLSIERMAQNRQKIAYTNLIHLPCCKNIVLDARTYSYVDIHTGILPDYFIASSDSYEDENYMSYFETQGGIFADEMGLGKTISMIALILSNPRHKIASSTNETAVFEKTISEVRTSELLSIRKKEEQINIDKQEHQYKGYHRAKMESIEYQEEENFTFFQSSATLIICPNQLVNQWMDEIKKNTKLKVIIAATVVQHKKLTYKLLLENDVVILSSRYLTKNKNYSKFITDQKDIPEIKKSPPKITDFQPNFHLVGWHRIILDEAHEFVTKKHIFDNFKSNFRWYVSGTPFPHNFTSFENAKSFVNCKKFYTSFEHYMARLNYDSALLANELFDRNCKRIIFWRNTKLSVENQVEIPPVSEEIEIVRLSPIERTIYDCLSLDLDNNREKRLFISEPARVLEDIGDLDDPNLPSQYLSHIKLTKGNLEKLLKYHRKMLIELQKEKSECEKLMARGKTKDLKAQMGFLTRRIIKAEKGIVEIELKIINEICKSSCVSRLIIGENTNEICDACSEFVCGRCEINTCNHFLCSDCIVKSYNSNNDDFLCLKCNNKIDICKISLSNDDKLPPLDVSILHPDESEQTWYNKVRNNYGSKIACTVKYLHHIMTSVDDVKLIVFSQYVSTLSRISSILEDVDRDVFENKMVMCKGSIHTMKKKLDRFTSSGPDSARILLLSLKHSASGTHLAVATHVLLLDPVVGSEGEARATDAQAIARAHRIGQGELVTAIRFIVIDTIDQQDYENAYGTVVVPKGYGPKSARK